MARPLNKLPARQITTIKEPGRYSDGGGLYLVIDERGGRRWIFRYRSGSRRIDMGLGPVADVPLSEARRMAQEARQAKATGKDPLETRRLQNSATTFGEAADSYLKTMAPQFTNKKHLWQWKQTLGDAYCHDLRRRPVAEVTTEDVLATLKPIWQEKPETASRLRGRIERVLDAAKANRLRSGENPARWRGHLDHLLPKPKQLTRGHHAAMPWQDVPEFMSKLRAVDTVGARCLEFTILTAARTGESIAAERSEIDLAAAVWTVPALRMKAKAEHRVPLCRRALEIVTDLAILNNRWVFPGNKRSGVRGPRNLDPHISNMAMIGVLRDMGLTVTVHGFRSSFRDWVGDATQFPGELAEAALAHTLGSKVEQAYRRSDALDKRRRLMDAWESYCMGRGDVVQIRSA